MEAFARKRNRVIAQIVLWVSLFGSMNLMFVGTDVPVGLYYRNFIHLGVALIIIIINSYVLIPRLFEQKKYERYALAVFVSLFVVLFSAVAIEGLLASFYPAPFATERPMRQPGGPPGPMVKYMLSLIIYAAVFMVGIVLESIQLNRRQEQLASEVQNEKLETELKFLKSQINPHFLFNVLNNVYTLSLIQSKQTPEVVMKLSEMLRYMLYDSNQERVTLEQEIDYIQHYIALQQLKDEEPLDVATTLDIRNAKVHIAPMILIPFVENAFKHSKIEDTENGWVKIKLIEDGSSIRFEVRNSILAEGGAKDPTGGIGLKNVRRRLELEYPMKYELNIDQEDQQFVIQLAIQL